TQARTICVLMSPPAPLSQIPPLEQLSLARNLWDVNQRAPISTSRLKGKPRPGAPLMAQPHRGIGVVCRCAGNPHLDSEMWVPPRPKTLEDQRVSLKEEQQRKN